MGNFRDILESLDVDFQKRDDELDETVSVQDYVDNRLATEFKKNGFNLTKNSFTKKMGYSVWSLEDNYEVINDGVGIKIKKDGKEIEYFDKPKLSYKDAVEFLSKEIMNESKKLQKLQPKDFKKGDKVKWSSAFNSPEKDMEGEVIGFKDHEDYKNGYLIIKGSDKKEYKKIFSGVVRVDEAEKKLTVAEVKKAIERLNFEFIGPEWFTSKLEKWSSDAGMGSQENIRIFYEIPSTNTEKDKKRKADVNIGVELLVKKFGFKNIVKGNNGTLIRPVNDGLLESTEDDSDEAENTTNEMKRFKEYLSEVSEVEKQ